MTRHCKFVRPFICRRSFLRPLGSTSTAKALSDELDSLLKTELRVDDPIDQTLGPAFYLPYHGRNDVDLQRKLAAVYARAIPSLTFVAPHCRVAGARTRSPIRVGLISRFFHQHVIGDHYAGLLRSFPRNQASYTVFQFPEANDTSPRGIEGTADEAVVLSLRLAEAREQIASRELDVLVYTDIGMESLTYFLAFARLARVQCVTLGHPVTSGIPTIDYFLSSDLLEPADADAHYTERLVRFANSPHYLSAPRIVGPPLSRGNFPLPCDTRWYVCHQTLFKIHPDFDRIIGEILRRDPKGIAVFFTGQQPDWTSLTRTPAGIPFGPHFAGLFSAADAIRGVSRVPASGRRADRFGPFLRRHDDLSALALGVPLVTLPGAFARGRGTAAVYRRIGVFDCIAQSPED